MAASAALALPGDALTYERHRPEQTRLYGLIEKHFPRFLERLDAEGVSLPHFVIEEFEAYLKCGRLEYGFLRVKCDACQHEKLVAFSCKRRGFYPSRGARRMADTAAHLIEHGRMCLHTRGPYFALMTLGFSEAVRLILQIEHDYTRGSLRLQIPYLFGEGLPRHILGYFVMLALAVITIVVLHRLVNSEKGLYFKAIREDEDVAAVMGVELVKWKVNAFVISSLFAGLAGLAGAIFAHLFVQMLAPQNLLLIEMGLILAMTIVGGLGTLTGPIIGAVLLVVMWEIMRYVSPYAHMLMFATLVILEMKFFHAGIFGLIADRLKARGLISRARPFTVE